MNNSDFFKCCEENNFEDFLRKNGKSFFNYDYLKRYFENLKYFLEWDSNNRLIVYYEDMISKPKDFFLNVISFLN